MSLALINDVRKLQREVRELRDQLTLSNHAVEKVIELRHEIAGLREEMASEYQRKRGRKPHGDAPKTSN